MSFVVDSLAAWRLAHLIVLDSFPPVERARDAVLDHYGPDAWQSYLLSCVWCLGVWSGTFVCLARTVAPRAWEPVGRALALAALVPIAEAAVERLEREGC